MKTRESGMPAEDAWSSFFVVEAVLSALGLDSAAGPIIDVGCGYGTFSLPIARLTGQRVIAIDIEPGLVQALQRRADAEHLPGVTAIVRDIAAAGIGEADASADVVLLFNLLHCEDPIALLREARRVLVPGGRVGIIHWRSDIPTPRGPDPAIRPPPASIVAWLEDAGFAVVVGPVVLEPYHFGLVGRRP